MRKRREARERALQFLFQCDQNPPENLQAALDHFWHTQRLTEFLEARGPTWGERVDLPAPTAEETATRLFADPLIKGTLERCHELDDIIRKHAKNWDLHRMAVVDRNVMRLAIFEMLYREDIPPIVSINEAVDIAKRFSTADSGKFVNGILDKVKAGILRPARTAKEAAEETLAAGGSGMGQTDSDPQLGQGIPSQGIPSKSPPVAAGSPGVEL